MIDLERSWRPKGACRSLPPEKVEATFFAPTRLGLPKQGERSNVPGWEIAKAICRECPVMYQCRRDTLGEEHGVWGGYDQHQRLAIRRAMPRAAKRWPTSRRLAFGHMVHMLRLPPPGGKEPRVKWATIQHMIGLPQGLASDLKDEYEAHMAALKAEREAKVVDLPLPELAPVPWPQGKGSRDLWVRNERIITDANYMGETEDGEWIRAAMAVRGSNVLKFFPAEDCHFYRDVPRYTVDYVKRSRREKKPKRGGARQEAEAA